MSFPSAFFPLASVLPARLRVQSPILICGMLLGFAVLFSTGCSPKQEAPEASDTLSDSESERDSSVDAGIDAGESGDTETDALLCGDIVPAVSMSEKISTVGIVTWSTSLSDVSGGRVLFGRGDEIEYTAPIDPDEPVLLLGMKPSTAYTVHVVLETGDTVCQSPPVQVETGALATGLPIPEVIDHRSDAVSGEFIVTSLATKRTVFILDKDGDIVWWYNFGNADYEGVDLLGFSRVHMSWDGKTMWGGNINFGRGNGRLYRVSMDGLEEAEPEITYHHHDFAVLPDNGLALIEFDEDGQMSGEGTCDRIVERAADGTIEVVYPLREGLAYLSEPTEWCHANAIHYVPSEDTYYVSVLLQNLIVKVNRADRRLEWVLDGDVSDESDFSGAVWYRQHGFHPLDDGTILIFNNDGTGGDGIETSSRVLTYSLDAAAGTADLLQQYDAGIYTAMLGDVQRLSNGNTLVAYSTAGVLHEIDDAGETVREIAFGFGDAIGYVDARKSLYGPPDRY